MCHQQIYNIFVQFCGCDSCVHCKKWLSYVNSTVLQTCDIIAMKICDIQVQWVK